MLVSFVLNGASSSFFSDEFFGSVIGTLAARACSPSLSKHLMLTTNTCREVTNGACKQLYRQQVGSTCCLVVMMAAYTIARNCSVDGRYAAGSTCVILSFSMTSAANALVLFTLQPLWATLGSLLYVGGCMHTGLPYPR